MPASSAGVELLLKPWGGQAARGRRIWAVQGPLNGGSKGTPATGEYRQWPHGTPCAAGAYP